MNQLAFLPSLCYFLFLKMLTTLGARLVYTDFIYATSSLVSFIKKNPWKEWYLLGYTWIIQAHLGNYIRITVSVLMLKTCSLYAGAESNLRDRILGWSRKEYLYCFARQRGVAGQNLGLLCPPKLNEKYGEFGGNRKVAFILSLSAGGEGKTVGSCLKNCASPSARSPGA